MAVRHGPWVPRQIGHGLQCYAFLLVGTLPTLTAQRTHLLKPLLSLGVVRCFHHPYQALFDGVDAAEAEDVALEAFQAMGLID
jgi:hypothetical protein